MESKIFNDNFKRFKKNNCVYHDESLESIFEVFKQIDYIVQNELMKNIVIILIEETGTKYQIQ